jgi:OmpA-OmpF porin, OOP family
MYASILIVALAAGAPAPAATEEVNALCLLSGARQVDETGVPLREPLAEPLIDGLVDRPWEPRIRDAGPVIFQLAEPFDLTSIEVVNSGNEEGWPGLSVKELKVAVAPAASGPWTPLADLKLEKQTVPQRFKASAAAARTVRVTLGKNWGNAEWYGIAELSIFGKRSAPRKTDFNGAWDTNYGELKLVQTGERIWGCYGEPRSKAGNAIVDGTVEGAVFAGGWREATETGAESSAGLMIFALTREGELSGVWGHGADPKERTARWDGRRKAAATVVCEPPERSLGKELAARGRVVLRGILFDTGKDVIRAESEPVLKELAAAMKAAPKKTYLIEGHTDDRGGKDYNQTLSEKRAASVKAWLEKAGVKVALKTVGFGQSKPAAPNTTDGGRAANRRVEVATE